ncbi:glycosyltransferase family 2 protein [[Candida] arabinofermentans NRRL YB-2248]|uniref:chitin synthase n=1 Tax=[Candida] arabinofermentans NRRL YB-2248 TaxID=983967 RepID=A0A1E4T6E9_9ASCO|nr:glycosyltransferase family 2 protein [[Candida] arabinofermentans NRRL YB-2248]
MSDPFREDPFDEFSKSPRRPENSYTPSNSPRRNSPSKAALKYSPAISFRRSESNNFLSSGMAHNFVMAAENRTPTATPRSKFTSQESPSRSKPVATVISMNSDDEDDNDEYDLGNHSPTRYNQSPSRFANSPFRQNTDEFTRSQQSNRTLEVPKPIFSASTYAAANSDNGIDPFRSSINSVPNLNPNVQSRSSSDSTQSTLNNKELPELTNKISYSSSFDAQSTIGSRTIDEKDEFSSSLDGHMFEQLPKDFQPRRNNYKATQKTFRSKNGNLILDNPVPSTLHNFLPRKGEDEFDYMKYSAVTSTADEFVEEGYTLRANDLDRETEIIVCITMYNEDEVALTRTLNSVFENIAYLAKRKNSSTWGKDSWKKVVVMIVADGRNKIAPGVLQILSAIGVYQEGIAKSFVNKKEVQAHLFEYTAQLSIDESLKFAGSDKGLCPVQVVFCLKERNAKKINSHRWLFNAVCPVLEPKVCVLLDVGTRPNESAIYNLWKAFDLDSNVAGAAGEIVAMKGKMWRKLINPIVASQNFEYKMSNILDKPCESVFGYITVLPGALSAYRYTALKNHDDGTGPLCSYFKGEVSDASMSQDIFSANMYLAEDRILAWELVAKRNAKWVLKYVKSAKGETDVPETLSEFISQRRRWLNGAFFAALYSQVHFYHIFRTDHSALRKFFLHLEFIYQFFTLLFSIFSIANFYLIFYYLAGAMINLVASGGKVFFEIMNYICICTLLSMLVISMGNRPQGAPRLFLASIILLTICGLYSIISGFYFLALMLQANALGESSSLSFASICVSLASTYGLYVLMSLLYLDPWHIISSSLQYFLMLPAYTCLLQIYALCNTHDVTWGTKGDNVPTSSLGAATITTNDEGQEVIKLEIVGDQRDIDSMYAENLYQLKERRKTPVDMRDGGVTKQVISGEDYYRDIRSRVVLFWVIANLILIMTITQIYSADSINNNKYLAFILWSVFGFAIFRFLGSASFLVHLLIRKCVVAKNKWDIRRQGGDDDVVNEMVVY